jgi:hypothetical protein
MTPTKPLPCAKAFAVAVTLAGGVLLSPPPASAAVTYTYAGAVRSGFDETGVFGLAGKDLTGLAFTAVFVRFDLPGADYFDEPTSTGIAGFEANSPLVATVTINGHVLGFGSYLGQQFQAETTDCGPECEYEEFSHNAQNYENRYDAATAVSTYVNDGVLLTGSGFNENFLPGRDYHTLPSLVSSQGVAFDGLVAVEDYRQASDGVRSGYRHGFAYLAPTSLTVSNPDVPAAAVPEPAAWALMILGFGAAGTMLRTRRRLAAA